MKLKYSERLTPLQISEISEELEFGLIAIDNKEVEQFHKKFTENVKTVGYDKREEYGHPILHKSCNEITKDNLQDPVIKKKLEFLLNNVMLPSVSTGGGLAANQIAVSARIFVMHYPNNDIMNTKRIYSEMINKSCKDGIFNKNKNLEYFISNEYLLNTEKPMYFINPEVIEESDDCILTWQEGCYSLPGYTLPKKRSATATLKYIDIDGKECVSKFFGWLAECAVHESSHLDGKLMIDEIPHYKFSKYIEKYKV